MRRLVLLTADAVLAAAGLGVPGFDTSAAQPAFGRNFVGVKLILDGRAVMPYSLEVCFRDTGTTLSGQRELAQLSPCGGFISRYDLAAGRLWPYGIEEFSGGEVLAGCRPEDVFTIRNRFDRFFLAAPTLAASGPDIRLQGPGITLVLRDRQAFLPEERWLVDRCWGFWEVIPSACERLNLLGWKDERQRGGPAPRARVADASRDANGHAQTDASAIANEPASTEPRHRCRAALS